MPRQNAQLVFLLNPTKISQIMAVAASGDKILKIHLLLSKTVDRACHQRFKLLKGLYNCQKKTQPGMVSQL